MKPSRYLPLSTLALTACVYQQPEPAPESCAGHCTELTGRLLTSGQRGLAGATVTASLITPGGGLGPVGYTKARTTTDANGSYQLRFFIGNNDLKSNYYNVLYTVDKQQYYLTGEESMGLSNLKRDTTYQLPPYLIPRKGAVALTVPNANQVVESFGLNFASAHGRTLTLPRQQFLVAGAILGGGEAVSVPQQATPFTRLVTVAAEQPLYIKGVRKTNGVQRITIDSLIVPAGTTRSVSISY